MHARRFIVTAGTIATGISLVGMEQHACAGEAPDTSSPEHVAQRIREIEKEISSIKRDRSPSWLTEGHEDELRALVREIEYASAKRASLLSNNGNAGYDRGFKIQSDSGDFTLVIDLFSQFQGIWNIRDMSSGDDSTFGFQNHRTRVIAKGRVYGDELRYHVAGDFRDRDNGDFTLTDAYLRAKLGNGASIWWGQMQMPFSGEQIGSDRRLLAVERSYMNEMLGTGDRTQGVMFKIHPNSQFRLAVMVNDGADINPNGENQGRANTSWDNDDVEFAFSGRGEFLWTNGDAPDNKALYWNRMDDYRPIGTENPHVKLGGGLHWQKGEYGTTMFEAEDFIWIGDINSKWNQFSVSGSVNGAHRSSNSPGSTDIDQIGFMVQGAVLLVEDAVDAFVRYEHIDFDGAVPAGYDDSVSLITGGFNYYFNGHGSKLTTDVVFGLDPIPASAGNLGILQDASDQDGQIVLRTQYQVAFK